jgi:hypothetical protein
VTQKITDAFNPLAESALCAWFGGEGIQRAVPWIVATGAAIPTPQTKAAALALTALQYGCNFKPDLSPEYIEGGCWERASPTFIEYYEEPYGQIPGSWTSSFSDYNYVLPMSQVLEIISFDGYQNITSPNGGSYTIHPVLTVRFFDNTEAQVTGAKGYIPNQAPPPQYFRMFDNGSECLKPAPNSETPPPPAPITQYSAELNCNVEAVFNGIQMDVDGTARPVITFKSLGAAGGTRQDPVPEVSGCNWFGDLVYVGPTNNKDPDVYPLPPNPPQVPGPPDPGNCPDPCPDIQPEMVGQSIYVMTAPCDKNESDQPLEWERVLEAQAGLPAISARLEALSEQVSQALAWKTPICNDKPTLEGNFRTISFRSDSTSPYGNDRLRKRFRYRSTSGLGLGAVVDHWKDFTWESGPVVVCHSGSSWGTPQVWAATADEGKRVIRHAAGEAGIDPDQVGRWTISGSDSARYGVSDTMRVDTQGGYYWITARDGSNNRPMVAEVTDP